MSRPHDARHKNLLQPPLDRIIDLDHPLPDGPEIEGGKPRGFI